MKTYKASEKEIDERLALDKRCDARGFYRYFSSTEELPAGFYELQDEIRDGLESELWKSFDDGVDHSKLAPWKKRRNKFFSLPAEQLNCEQVGIEMSKEILGDKLVGLVMSYLEKLSARYSVVVAVYESMESDNYLGRFVINLDEIAVEESLADTWSKQVKFMEIENLQNQRT